MVFTRFPQLRYLKKGVIYNFLFFPIVVTFFYQISKVEIKVSVLNWEMCARNRGGHYDDGQTTTPIVKRVNSSISLANSIKDVKHRRKVSNLPDNGSTINGLFGCLPEDNRGEQLHGCTTGLM